MTTATVHSEKTVIAPTVHLNGTSADELLSQIERAFSAVNEATQALSNAAPHGRDYYIHGEELFQAATREHLNRVRRLQSVAEELLAIHGAVLKQQEQRAARSRV